MVDELSSNSFSVADCVGRYSAANDVCTVDSEDEAGSGDLPEHG